jgi:hypothetical protein
MITAMARTRSIADSSKDSISGTYHYIKYYDVINIFHTDRECAHITQYARSNALTVLMLNKYTKSFIKHEV